MLRRVTVLASIGSLGAALTSVDLQHLQWVDLRYVVIALACVFSYGLLRTGRTQAAVLTLIWCIGLFLLAMAFVGQGVRTPGLIRPAWLGLAQGSGLARNGNICWATKPSGM